MPPKNKCPECNGTGEIQEERDDGDEADTIEECPVCGGTGDADDT